jgi:hypothetical protein
MIVDLGYLMCRKHWLQLPLPIKETVSQSWGDLKNCREKGQRMSLELAHRNAITMAIRFFRVA